MATPAKSQTSAASSSSIATKKAVDPERIDAFKAFIAEFSKESDRAAVILGAARLDILLKQLILAFLLPTTSTSDELLDGDSPLGTFSSRIQLSYRLNLLDAEFVRALNLIRRIRNEFAHEASSVSLAHPSHRDRIKQLVAPMKKTTVFAGFETMPLLEQHKGSAREFRAMLAFMCARLEGAVLRTQQLKPEQVTPLVLEKWVSAAESK